MVKTTLIFCNIAGKSSRFVFGLGLEDFEGSKMVNWKLWFSFDTDFEFVFKKCCFVVFQLASILQPKQLHWVIPSFILWGPMFYLKCSIFLLIFKGRIRANPGHDWSTVDTQYYACDSKHYASLSICNYNCGCSSETLPIGFLSAPLQGGLCCLIISCRQACSFSVRILSALVFP